MNIFNPQMLRAVAATRAGIGAAAALHAGCDTLWSEDMQHGMEFDEGLRIVNPFRAES